MSKEEARLRLKSITIQNWKGFKDCKLELYDGLNVLVGPNSSGKTSLLEAFKFLKKALVEMESPYLSHLEWWTYRNIVYGNDETKPIRFELEFELPEEYTATYEVVFTGVGGNIKIAKEKMEIKKVVSFTKEGETLTIEYDRDFFEKNINIVNRRAYKIEQKRRIKVDFSYWSLVFISGIIPLIPIKKYVENEVELLSFFLHIFRPVREVFLLSPELKTQKKPLVSYALYSTKEFFEKILFIRHPDLVDIRQPKPHQSGYTLSERGENLAAILHRWFLQGGGRLPDRIERALQNLFPYFTLRPDITVDGRVFLSIQDGMYGARLDPPSIPDGFYKLLHVLTAVESEPSILLIDELENSLHSEILEYIVEELKNANITSIVATHSPIVVDVAGLECLQLLERTPEGNKVRRVENLEEIQRWMREKKLTPSEMWLYQLQ
ncbi:MAG: AAA family ATPase [Thermoproteota archaeon]